MPAGRDLSRLSVILKPEVKQELERLARARSVESDSDVPVSELVREAIAEYLAKPAHRDSLHRIAESRAEYQFRTSGGESDR